MVIKIGRRSQFLAMPDNHSISDVVGQLIINTSKPKVASVTVRNEEYERAKIQKVRRASLAERIKMGLTEC